MDLGADLSWFGTSLKIFFIDILLSGDNALLIALACRSLPASQVPRAVALGAAGAIFFRLIIAALAGTLLVIPMLKIAGGVLLLIIAINLLAGEYRRRREGEGEDRRIELDPAIADGTGFLGAALLILIADAIMSLDNVVALAAVSEGHLTYLVGGVLFSVPLIFFGSFVMAQAMKQFPALILMGAAFLGWISGSLIASDPLWSGWINTNAEALTVLLPLAAAFFVVVEARITAEARHALAGGGAAPVPLKRGAQPLESPPVTAPVASPPRKIEAAATSIPAGPVLQAGAPRARPSADANATDGDRLVMAGLIGLCVVVAVVMFSVVVLTSHVG
ncbi:YjbE family putative metal transport protein [Xanthobacter autotrophicus DSM 431]|uniref:YjbE family putative metal transport protein n=1 Tax=Xanthobacter nonsaccharivorans TaxID=3119912 RepID=UPI00372B3E01